MAFDVGSRIVVYCRLQVDTHIHHSAAMHQKHLLRFIKKKLKVHAPSDFFLSRKRKRRRFFAFVKARMYNGVRLRESAIALTPPAHPRLWESENDPAPIAIGISAFRKAKCFFFPDCETLQVDADRLVIFRDGKDLTLAQVPFQTRISPFKPEFLLSDQNFPF